MTENRADSPARNVNHPHKPQARMVLSNNIPLPVGADFAAGQKLGAGILDKMVIRERERLQAEFLNSFSRLPVSRYTTLVGGAALHGVYLHKRWTSDLDFAAPYIVVERFVEAIQKAGVSLRDDDRQISDGGKRFIYRGSDRVFIDTSIGLEVFAMAERTVTSVEGIFRSSDGRLSAPVRCCPLAELLLTKIGCIFHRNWPVDYVDLWYGLMEDPETLVDTIGSIWRNQAWHGGIFSPPRPLDVQPIMARMITLHDEWKRELSAYFPESPGLARVQSDLTDLLAPLKRI